MTEREELRNKAIEAMAVQILRYMAWNVASPASEELVRKFFVPASDTMKQAMAAAEAAFDSMHDVGLRWRPKQ